MRFLFLILILVTAMQSFAIDPDRNYKATPDSLGVGYEQFTLTTPDGYELNAWKIPPIRGDRDTTIILAYGDAGNMSYFVQQAAMLAYQGFTVLMFDYRGFGKSADFEMNFDYLYYDAFATDLSTAIRWTKENIETEKTGIWALSMGTIAATFTLQNEKADFLIAEGFVADPHLQKKRIENRNKDELILLPESHAKYKSLLENLAVPMLIFAGTEDKITTLQDAESVVSQKENRKLVSFQGDHMQGWWKMSGSKYGEKYYTQMIAFIEGLG